MMPRAARNRFSALLMLLLLVGGSPGLSSLDAILFHIGGPVGHPIHVEATGASCHAEACLEWTIGLLGRLVPPAGLPVSVRAPVSRWSAPSRPRLAPGARPAAPRLARSPPASLASRSFD